MKDMCAECGADLRINDLETTASVPMIHTVPELKVSVEVNMLKNNKIYYNKAPLIYVLIYDNNKLENI